MPVSGRLCILVFAISLLVAAAPVAAFISEGNRANVHYFDHDPRSATLIEWQQLGRNLQVEIFDPSGNSLGRFDAPGRAVGREFVLLENDRGGRYRLLVHPSRKFAAAGRYELTITPLPAASRQLRSLRSITEANLRYCGGEEADIRRAIELYTAVAAAPGPYRNLAAYYAAFAESAHGDRGIAYDLLRAHHSALAGRQSALALLYRELEARSWLYLGDLEKSAALFSDYEQELENRIQDGHKEYVPELVSAHDYQCVLQCYRNRFAEISVCHDNLLESRRLKDAAAEGWALTNLAACQMQQGDASDALAYLEPAQNAFQRAELSSYYAQTLSWRAEAHRQLGEFETAKFLIEEALQRLERNGRSLHLATAYRRAATIYLQVGDFERARTYAHSAVELSEQNDNRELRARSQRLLGIALRELGESEPALVSFEAALAYYDSGRGKPTERVAATIDYAVALRRAGQSGRAAELARKVYADRAKLGDRQIRGDAILKSAGLLEAANRRDALRLIRESLELFTAAEYRIGQIEAYAALADWYLAAGRLGESVSYGMRAIKLADTMESFLEAERQGPAFKDKTFDVYGTVISALLQDRGSDRQSAAARAFEVVSRAKAQRARIRLDGTDESLRSKRRAVSDAMIARMKAAESGDADSVASAQLRVVRAVDAFEAAISAQGLGADTVRHRATLRFTQAALPQNTLLLVFLWSRDRGWRFEIDRATLKVAELPPASTLEPIINAVYRALQESHRFPVRYARQLGRILLPEALPDVETILVLPDGPLNVLPLGVLAQPGRDGYIPVARRFTVSHLTALPAGPSAARADRIELERGIALVVDPFVAQQRPMDPGSAWRGWPGGQGPLPWSVREAEAIAKLFRDKPVTILRGERATVAALEAPGVVDKAILHIATHGFFSSELDNMAALIFFRQQGGSRASDALLTPQDARVLPLAANLVVLNGCQTAIGASFRGEGIGGMTRAFIDNGASSAIGTLWQVPDRAAARLLTRFYEILMAQNGSDVATALAASKREFMDSGRYRNPFFWAGYVHHTTLQLVH